jgi:hypothetical protein
VEQKFCNYVLLEGIYVLGKLCFKEEAWFHLNGYFNNQNHRRRSAENPHALHKNPPHLTRLVLGAQCLEKKKVVGHFSLKRHLLRKIIKIFDSIYCSAGRERKGNAGYSKMGLPPMLQKI